MVSAPIQRRAEMICQRWPGYQAGGDVPAPLPGQRADFTRFQRPVFIRNHELHGATDRVTFESLYPRHWHAQEHSDGWQQLFYFWWMVNKPVREPRNFSNPEAGAWENLQVWRPGLWPARRFSWEKMGPTLPRWPEMTSDCSYRLQHLLPPGPWKEVGRIWTHRRISQKWNKTSASISTHAFGAEISATMDILYIAPSLLVSTFHFPSCLFPNPWRIWFNHVFSASLIMGKFDQNVQLTVNSVLVMN